MTAILYALGALALVIAPLLPGLLELYQKTDTAALGIDRSHVGSANAFAVNYRKRLATLGPDAAPVDWNARFAAQQDQARPTLEEEVLAQGELCIPEGFSCLKEVYCKGDIATGAGVILRSALAEGELRLGEDSSVLRWAGARDVRAAPGCSLFGRLVAEDTMRIEGPISFQRIQAAAIRLGDDWQMEPPPPPGGEVDISRLPHTLFYNAAMRRAVVNGDFVLPERSVLRGNLVVRGQLKIGHGCRVDGSVKAGGSVRIGRGAVINGSVISDQSVIALGGCRIFGPVVADRLVSIGPCSVLGAPDAPISVSSRFVLLKLPLVTHGTVWARARGKVIGL